MAKRMKLDYQFTIFSQTQRLNDSLMLFMVDEQDHNSNMRGRRVSVAVLQRRHRFSVRFSL
jgi:hypothetical protein